MKRFGKWMMAALLLLPLGLLTSCGDDDTQEAIVRRGNRFAETENN